MERPHGKRFCYLPFWYHFNQFEGWGSDDFRFFLVHAGILQPLKVFQLMITTS